MKRVCHYCVSVALFFVLVLLPMCSTSSVILVEDAKGMTSLYS